MRSCSSASGLRVNGLSEISYWTYIYMCNLYKMYCWNIGYSYTDAVKSFKHIHVYSPLSRFTCTEIYSLLFCITCGQTSIPKPSHSFFTVTHTHCKIHVHVYTCSVAYFLHQRWLLIFSMVYLLAGLGFRIFFSNATIQMCARWKKYMSISLHICTCTCVHYMQSKY